MSANPRPSLRSDVRLHILAVWRSVFEAIIRLNCQPTTLVHRDISPLYTFLLANESPTRHADSFVVDSLCTKCVLHPRYPCHVPGTLPSQSAHSSTCGNSPAGVRATSSDRTRAKDISNTFNWYSKNWHFQLPVPRS